MPVSHDEAVCIRHWDYSETSQTVGLYSRASGLMRAIAKGARRQRGSFGGGIDLLTRGEFGVIARSGQELSSMVEWTLLETFPHLRTSIAANRIAYYAADMVGRMSVLHDPHPELYDALVRVLQEAGSGAPALLRFQWALLSESGWQPRLDPPSLSPGEVVSFDPRGGGVVAASPPGAWKVRWSTIEAIRATASGETGSDAAPDTLDRANRLLAAYLRDMMGSEPDTMRTLFGALARS
jgi:DNA repair protein RecO (recombination protein O)